MDVTTTDNYTEQLIFFYVIKNYDMASIFKPTYFSQDILKKLFELVQPYIIEYKEEPTEDMVYTLIQQNEKTAELPRDIIRSIWSCRKNLSNYAEDWLRSTTKGFAEWNNFIVAVNRMSSYLMQTQYDVTPESAHTYIQKVKTMFSSDANFTLGDKVGHDFFDPMEHKLSKVETRTTGYKFMDTCLNGGWAKKTLNVLMGPPKVGKSMWLCNLCANSVLNGDNCVYISLEMSVQIVNHRIGSNLMSIPIRDYDQYADDLNMMKQRLSSVFSNSMFGPGALIVEEFPTSSATVYDIESFILNVEKSRSIEGKEFKIRNVFIDYVNIMADARYGNSPDTYMKIKSICEDIRAMAQRNDWCVISLTQTNRAGMGASDLDMTSVAESSGLIATVDSLYGIICTPVMKASGIYYLKAIALRNSPNMGDKKKYLFTGDYMRIKEDPSEGIIPDTVPLPGSFDATNTILSGSGKSNPAPIPAIQPQPATINEFNPIMDGQNPMPDGLSLNDNPDIYGQLDSNHRIQIPVSDPDMAPFPSQPVIQRQPTAPQPAIPQTPQDLFGGVMTPQKTLFHHIDDNAAGYQEQQDKQKQTMYHYTSGPGIPQTPMM